MVTGDDGKLPTPHTYHAHLTHPTPAAGGDVSQRGGGRDVVMCVRLHMRWPHLSAPDLFLPLPPHLPLPTPAHLPPHLTCLPHGGDGLFALYLTHCTHLTTPSTHTIRGTVVRGRTHTETTIAVGTFVMSRASSSGVGVGYDVL